MCKFLILIEEYPWEFTLYFILMIIALISIIYSCIKIYIYRQVRETVKRCKNSEKACETELPDFMPKCLEMRTYHF